MNFTEGINEVLHRCKNTDIRFIGIVGGSASGKSFFAQKIKEKIKDCMILEMDNYFKPKNEQPKKKEGTLRNFDQLKAYDLKLLIRHLKQLKNNQEIDLPKYNFEKSERCGYKKMQPKRVIIIEGLFACHKTLRPFLNLKIFVHADEKLRFKRRLKRDTEVRKIPGEIVRRRWKETVLPMHKKYVEPQRKYTDLVVTN